MHVIQPTHHEFMMDVDGWIFDLTIDKGELMLRNINFVYSDEMGSLPHKMDPEIYLQITCIM